jgi:hypothetical protein
MQIKKKNKKKKGLGWENNWVEDIGLFYRHYGSGTNDGMPAGRNKTWQEMKEEMKTNWEEMKDDVAARMEARIDANNEKFEVLWSPRLLDG